MMTMMMMTMTRYDFSILTLAQPVTFTTAVNPACLPWNVDEDYTGHVISTIYLQYLQISTIYLQISTHIYVQVATVTGWGTTTFGGSQPSALQEVNVTVTSNTQCENAYGSNVAE